uniref:EGF-like domain-containing protein n=1 Tax=Romanomermis culicivorax TaxID=13658 RepID=A0A915JD37_ROMCU
MPLGYSSSIALSILMFDLFWAVVCNFSTMKEISDAETCAENEWGHDCENCCHCENGPCNALTGQCNGACKKCWTGAPACDTKEPDCKVKSKECGFNAISFSETDKCGDVTTRCQCLAGFTGDGATCSDINECANDNTHCSPYAKCINTPGRFYCECIPGYVGNGTLCQEAPDKVESPTAGRSAEVTTLGAPATVDPTEKAEETTDEQKPTVTNAVPIEGQDSTEESSGTTSGFSTVSPLDSVILLPNVKDSKLTFVLNYPLTIFGTIRRKLTRSRDGFSKFTYQNSLLEPLPDKHHEKESIKRGVARTRRD